MRIAVTGRSGQIATSLRERCKAFGHEVLAVGRPEMDLTQLSTVGPAIEDVWPDAIVSAAAYTSVDKAESNKAQAFEVNEAGALAVAKVAKRLSIPLIHLSTDYVFDGALDRPYRETDLPNPQGVYGASKLAGDLRVLDAYRDNSVILRFGWVYSPFSSNFVKTMLKLAEQRASIAVVSDQVGNPTSAFDIADGIMKVLTNLDASKESDLRGLFHMTAQGEGSWADLAEAVFARSAAIGGPRATVCRIKGSDYSTSTFRPTNSRLDCSLISNRHGVALPNWRDALSQTVDRLVRR